MSIDHLHNYNNFIHNDNEEPEYEQNGDTITATYHGYCDVCRKRYKIIETFELRQWDFEDEE